MPELTAGRLTDYDALALRLAGNLEELAAVRAKAAAQRMAYEIMRRYLRW
jgi:hypothetical protein